MCFGVMGKKPILSGKGGAPPLSEGSLAWKMVLTEPLALIIMWGYLGETTVACRT